MRMLKGLHFVWVFILNIQTTSYGYCGDEPAICSECRTTALCETSDKNYVIPQKLPRSLDSLHILYVGNESVELTQSMFNRYQKLTTIILLGEGIGSLGEGLFFNLQFLKHLSIYKTKINQLPKNLLPLNNKITTLNLPGNHLANIPYHLFTDLPQLTNLNLGFNRIFHQNCSTIGLEFELLPMLTNLNLSNITVRPECEANITADFFKPIASTVKIFNLTIANIYGGDPKIFKEFDQLQKLDISLAKSFLDCPSKASELFAHLPYSLETLVLRRWRTDSVMIPECAVSNETMASLKLLPNLTRLDMKYGDLMFGGLLKAHVFDGFQHLSELNIGYARFSAVEDFVFENCPNLTFLSMDGNPVGARPIRLFRNRTTSALKHLKLKRANVYSDYSISYQSGQLSVDAPLEQLNLGRNYITKMPFFVNNQTILNNYDDLRSINLDHNFLIDVQSGGNLAKQCQFLPKLQNLSIANNRLEKVKGLCLSITKLNVAFNKLYIYWESVNQQAISILSEMKILDLSYNQITSLSVSFTAGMLHLTELRLTGNNITSFDAATFSHNGLLEVLDLRNNYLNEFNHPLIKPLTKLRKLMLEDNIITSIDQKLISNLSDSESKVEHLGLLGNPFSCSCDQKFFQDWIKKSDNIVPFANRLECSGATDMNRRLKKVYEYKRDYFLCDLKDAVIVLGAIIGAILIAIPCYKYRWYITHIRVVGRAVINNLTDVRLEHKCEYDAYVMYNSSSDDDLNWVTQDLRLAIETDSGEKSLKLYIHDRDTLPGSTVYTEMISAMEKSRKILIVLSNSYLKKPQCKGQADLAGRESYGRKFYQPNRIMVLVREELEEEAIAAPFTSLLRENVVDVYNMSERRTMRTWQRIRHFISKPKYEYVRKNARTLPESSNDFVMVEIELNEEDEDCNDDCGDNEALVAQQQ